MNSSPTETVKAEYVILQSALPKEKIENIGVLLLDAESNRMYVRYRRDFDEFAGDEADVFQLLPESIADRTRELGAKKCIDWMESKLSNTVRISERKSVLVSDYGRTLGELYAQHVRPNVLQYRTHLPQYTIQAAAGKFGTQMDSEPEGWIEVYSDTPLNRDMFVTHVTGHSMEPRIPDASLCAFQSNVRGSWDGRILLIEHYGESGGNRYTVKLVKVTEDSPLIAEGALGWLHQPVTLESLNPKYPPWDIPSDGKIRALGEFLFVVGTVTAAAQ